MNRFIIMGGSWVYDKIRCQTAYAFNTFFINCKKDLGFRLIKTLK